MCLGEPNAESRPPFRQVQPNGKQSSQSKLKLFILYFTSLVWKLMKRVGHRKRTIVILILCLFKVGSNVSLGEPNAESQPPCPQVQPNGKQSSHCKL